MVKCQTCGYECTLIDFVTLSNVCEHLYLDSLAKKQTVTEETTKFSLDHQVCLQE